MLCKDALITKTTVAKPDQTVEEVLKEMRKKGSPVVPVLDGDKVLVGIFSFGILLDDALPVSLAMPGGDEGPIKVFIPAAPGMSKRLQRSMMLPVSTLMIRPSAVLHPDTPIETVIRELRESGGAMVVVERQSNVFSGIVTNESVLEALEGRTG